MPMNILFLTMSKIDDVSEHDIYQDLIRNFISSGHNVIVVTPTERSTGKITELFDSYGCKILRVKICNQSNCNIIEKGLSLILLRFQYLFAISKFLKGIHFDLILYSTPPITIAPIVSSLKRKHNCVTYLMLKDIFPQNAVDLKMFSKTGVIYNVFRKIEQRMYDISDYIGCMSPANIRYLLDHNDISKEKVELCPNGIDAKPFDFISREEKKQFKLYYNLPCDKIIIVYGGNLGKPQGVPFLAECVREAAVNDKFHFVIVGGGTEFNFLDTFIKREKLGNVTLLTKKTREDYLGLIRAADIGLIALDERFTIPNFPSRILPYMERFLPIACVTDSATDIGTICRENAFGWSCCSGDVSSFLKMLCDIERSDVEQMGLTARRYLEEHYSSRRCYETIAQKVNLKESKEK